MPAKHYCPGPGATCALEGIQHVRQVVLTLAWSEQLGRRFLPPCLCQGEMHRTALARALATWPTVSGRRIDSGPSNLQTAFTLSTRGRAPAPTGA